jgi:putative ABC transport system substrate-binding protein
MLLSRHTRRREFTTLLGGAIAWPLAARAQQPAMPVIGFMSARSPEDSEHLVEAFRRGLREGGFVEGQNVAIEFRWARGNRPGGNATGDTLYTNIMEPKRLGLLRELVPGVPLIGVLLNPSLAPYQLPQIEEAARSIDQRILVAKASTDEELMAAFAALTVERVGALLVAADPYFDTRRDQIVGFAERQRLPAIYHFREYAVAGGLLSYGVSVTDGYRQRGVYTARILKGAKPVDLPVLQPTKFETVINLKTAKALGIKISDNLLSLADEVIE